MLSNAKNTLADMMLINKATTTTNTPVSGPQLSEISEASKESDDHCKSIIDQLEKRIEKDNVTIKFKCLKIILHLIENGNTNFSTFMGNHLDILKSCQSYNGPADPLRGMEPYTALHTLAQQVISFITSRNDNQFIVQPTRQANALFGGGINKPKVENKIVPNKEMVGLGSSSFSSNDRRNEDWTEKAKNLGHDNISSNQVNNNSNLQQNINIKTLPSNVGPNAVGKPSYIPPQSVVQQQKVVYKQMAGSANSDGTYERGLVNELCQPGGMRPIPPKDKLIQFTKHIKTLDPLLIGPILLSKLNDENWQVQSKCLCVIENIILTDDNPQYNDYFKNNTDELDYLILNGKPQVQKKANDIKNILFNIKEEKEEIESDNDIDNTPIKQVPQQNIKPNNIDDNATDLFSNMDTNTSHINNSTNNTSTSNNNNQNDNNNEDLFGGLSVQINDIPAANVKNEQQNVNKDINNISNDLLNNLDFGNSSSQPDPSQDSFNAFDNVQIPPQHQRTNSGSGMYNQPPSYPPENAYNQYQPNYNMPPTGQPYPGVGQPYPPNIYPNVQPNITYTMPQIPSYIHSAAPSYPPQTQPGMYNPGGYPNAPQAQQQYPGMPPSYGVQQPQYNPQYQPHTNYQIPQKPGYPTQQQPRPQQPVQKKPDHFTGLLGKF